MYTHNNVYRGSLNTAREKKRKKTIGRQPNEGNSGIPYKTKRRLSKPTIPNFFGNKYTGHLNSSITKLLELLKEKWRRQKRYKIGPKWLLFVFVCSRVPPLENCERSGKLRNDLTQLVTWPRLRHCEKAFQQVWWTTCSAFPISSSHPPCTYWSSLTTGPNAPSFSGECLIQFQVF